MVSNMVLFKKPTANRFASLTDSLRGDPNLVEGLLSLLLEEIGSGAALLAKIDVLVVILRREVGLRIICVNEGTGWKEEKAVA